MSLHKALVLFNCSYTPLFNSSADRFSEEWFVTKCLIFVCGNDVFQVKLILDSTSVSFHSYPSNTPFGGRCDYGFECLSRHLEGYELTDLIVVFLHAPFLYFFDKLPVCKAGSSLTKVMLSFGNFSS